jgi:hypothetical protein
MAAPEVTCGTKGYESQPFHAHLNGSLPSVRDKIVAETLAPPEGALTHWSRARLAQRVGVSASTVSRVWRETNLKPHGSESFKYSDDPDLIVKVTDVVGLYLDPPERAIVLSVNEKTQVQALDRTQPMLPLRPGLTGQTHDYRRDGTMSLFAALDVATGRAMHDTHERHTGADSLAFLKCIARAYPKGEVHLILENVLDAQDAGRAGVAREARALRVPLHAHERLVDEPDRALVRHSDASSAPSWVVQRRARLVAAVDAFTSEWNDRAAPFAWSKPPTRFSRRPPGSLKTIPTRRTSSRRAPPRLLPNQPA